MAKYQNPRKTWRYTNEFKARAVELSLQEEFQVQQVAEGLGIHPFTLSRWRKEYREGNIRPSGGRRMKVGKNESLPSGQELSKVKRLEKEVARLKQENDLLKKWQRYLAERHQSDLDSSRSTEKY
jgi:transposase